MKHLPEIKKYWDHKTSPSTYVILADGEEAFRGTHSEGEVYVRSLGSGGMISFENDFLPEMRKVTKNLFRAMMSERGLRREIIKLKKENKELESGLRRKARNDLTNNQGDSKI